MTLRFRWPLHHDRWECCECGCKGHWHLQAPWYRVRPLTEAEKRSREITLEILRYAMPPVISEMWDGSLEPSGVIHIPTFVYSNSANMASLDNPPESSAGGTNEVPPSPTTVRLNSPDS